MGSTRDKLDETVFFLQALERHHYEHPTFNYYLSAFVSAARSVTWIMKSEYHDVSGWQLWYDSQHPAADEYQLLQYMTGLRNRAQKQASVETHYRLAFRVSKVDVTDELERFIQAHAVVGSTLRVTVAMPGDSNTEVDTRVETNTASFACTLDQFICVLDEFPDDDVIEVCKNYYTLLNALVTECEAHFGIV